MPEEDNIVRITLNLLLIRENNPTPERLLEFLCVSESPERMMERYKAITGEDHNKLAILPAEANILNKIVLPLRAAIGSYMAANYLGTVAICGTVCEMLAILNFDLAMLTPGQERPDEKKVFGRKFEELGQSRRIDVLRGMRIIDDDTERLFKIPLDVRRNYLHFFSRPHEPIAEDAKKAWDATRELVLRTLKMRLKEGGTLVLPPALARYLKEKGASQD